MDRPAAPELVTLNPLRCPIRAIRGAGIYDRTMTTAAEIVVVCAAALFALSLVALAAGRASEPVLVAIGTVFGAAAAAAIAGLAVSVIRADGDWRVYVVAFASLAAFAVGEIGLAALNRARARDRRLTTLIDEAYGHIDQRLESHAKQRATELERTLATERARSQHAIIEQERELSERRRAALADAEESATSELLHRNAALQDELGARIRAWSDDLTRAQDETAARLGQQGREQNAILDEQRDQVDAHTRALHGLNRDQQQTIEEARAEFSQIASVLGEELRRDLEREEQYFRQEIAQLSERLKAVSSSLREDAYREEIEARTRLAADIGEAERRVVTALERSLERAGDRVVEAAERRFDEQIRESREETGTRLSAELESTRAAYAQQIEEQVEARMQEVAKQTTQRLQRQLDQVVRQAESQTSTAEDRITFITQRLEATMETAAGRVAAFESELELELTTKLTEFERAVRHAEQSVGRETG